MEREEQATEEIPRWVRTGNSLRPNDIGGSMSAETWERLYGKGTRFENVWRDPESGSYSMHGLVRDPTGEAVHMFGIGSLR